MINRWKPGPIGVDVGERHVCVAQVAWRAGAEPRLIAAARLPRGKQQMPTGEKLHSDEAAQLLGTLQRQGFRGNQIVLGLPRPMLMSGVLDLPPRGSGAPLEMIARSELARANRATPEAMESTWWELPTPARAGGGMCAMAVGCTHAAAETIAASFDSLVRVGKAELVAIDARCVATSRACEPILVSPASGKGMNTVGGVLELGWSRAELTMLIGATPMYERPLDDGGMCRVHARLVSELSVDPEVAGYLVRHVSLATGSEPARSESLSPDEAQMLRKARVVIGEHLGQIADEVRVAFGYALGRYPSSDEPCLLVTGEGAAVGGTSDLLGERIGVAARVVRPSDVVSVDTRAFVGREEIGSDPSLMTALGLAGWESAAEMPQGVAA